MAMPTYPVELGLNFGMSLHLHPYFVYAGSEGSDWSGHMLQNVVLALLGPETPKCSISSGSALFAKTKSIYRKRNIIFFWMGLTL